MNSVIDKVKLPPRLKGTDKLLYEKLLEKIYSIPLGMPMPSAQKLKKEFNVGYGKLKRTLDYLETEGRIVVRNGHGIFINKQPVKKSSVLYSKHNPVPWLKMDMPEILFQMPASHPELNMWQELVNLYNNSVLHAKVIIKTTTSEYSKGEKNTDITYFSSKVERLTADPALNSFLDLSPFIEQLPPELPVYDCAWDRNSSDSETIIGAAPYLVTGFIAYQRNAFKKAGITWSKTPTWEELLIAGNALKKNYGGQKSFIFNGYMPFFSRWGISLTDGKQIVIDQESVAPLLLFLRKLVEDRITPYWSEIRDVYHSQHSFLKGCGAIEAYSYFDIDKKGIGFVPVPLKNGGKELVFSPLLCVNANSPWPEECWKFIRFVLSEMGQRIVARYSHALPAAKDILPDDICTEKLEVMRHTVEHGQVMPNEYSIPFRARSVIQAETERWLKKETSVSEWCNKVEERCALFLNRC